MITPTYQHPLVCIAPGCGLEPGHNSRHAASKEDLLAGNCWVDLRPTSAKMEWNITYACDLECTACNRASFLRKPHTPNMTLDDARDCIAQMRALEFTPFVIVIIGGEPTMHPDFEQFVKLARTSYPNSEVWIISNGRTEKRRQLLELMRVRYSVSLHYDAYKLHSIGKDNVEAHPQDWYADMFVSPTDHGLPLREPCYTHASVLCGIALDHAGYSPCALGGPIDGLLGPGLRTKRLADLFDKDKAAELTAKFCHHCGYNLMRHNPEAMAAAGEVFDTPMSETWRKAFEGRK